MGKIAFVFSGQGAQTPGMGKDLAETSRSAADVFKQAEQLRQGTAKQCFNGTQEELTETRNTQPCLFCVDLAAAKAVEEAGIHPDMIAGYSLGEIAALTYSGAMDFNDGFQLVCQRGEYMQEASARVDSGMVAVLKLDQQTVVDLCEKYQHVYPVNFNCPGQVTVSGVQDELADFKNDVKEKGGLVRPLQVSGAFHCPFMEDAARKLRVQLKKLPIHDAKMPVYSNYTGRPYSGDYHELIEKQIVSPVRWQTIIENMIQRGVDTFIEVGAGNILSKITSRIDPSVRVFSVENQESLFNTVREVRQYA